MLSSWEMRIHNMKLKNIAILLFITGIVDTYISYVFAVDFTFQTMSFVPHVTLMALLMMTYDRVLMDRILIGALFGLLYDFFFQSSFPISFFLFPLASVFVGFVYEKKENLLYLAGVTMLSGFLYDFIPYFISRLFHVLQLHFWTWFFRLEFATLIFQLITLLFLYFGMNLFQSFKQNKSKWQLRFQWKFKDKKNEL